MEYSDKPEDSRIDEDLGLFKSLIDKSNDRYTWKHGGLITVESKLGIGTTFYIYLPASDKRIPN